MTFRNSSPLRQSRRTCSSAPIATTRIAPGDRLHDKARHLLSGGHCSYKYVGKGLTNEEPPTTPIAYEAVRDHGPEFGKGMHVLFADGHVEWFAADQVADILARVATRPTTAPTTAEATP